MADFPAIPAGFGIPLVDMTSYLFPEPTMEAMLERYSAAVFDIRRYAGDFKTALDAARDDAAVSGGVVLIPAGVHEYPGYTEAEAMGIVADGVIYRGEGGTILRLASAVTDPVMLPIGGVDVRVEGITFDTELVSNATCVRIYDGSARVSVTGCTFNEPRTGGVYIDDGTVSDVIIDANHFNGSRFGVLTRDETEVTGLVISDNTFRGGIGGDAIEINSPDGTARGITITGNTISGYARLDVTNSGIGIGIARARDVSITGNRVDDCGLDGIHVEDASHNVVVTGNVVTDCGRSGIAINTALGSSADTDLTGQVNVSDNVVTGCGLTYGDAGLALEGGTLAPTSVDHIVSNNIVRGCGRSGVANYAGIRLSYGITRVIASGNISVNTIGGAEAAGIAVDSSTDVLIIGNRCTDDQTVKTQKYGLYVNGGNSRATVIANIFTGNATAERSNPAGTITDLALTQQLIEADWITDGESTMPRTAAISQVVSVPSNTMRITAFVARRNRTVTKLRVHSGTTAAGATPSVVQLALFSVSSDGGLVKLSETANDTTLLASTNTVYDRALGASVALEAGRRYAIGVLVVSGATLPTLTGATALGDQSGTPRYSHAYAASGSIPTNISLAGTSATSWAPYLAAVE